MFIEKRGDEMKLMRCIGQSVLHLVVEDGKAYPIPFERSARMHRILPDIPCGETMRDGTYTVDDMRSLRSLLSRAGEYARLGAQECTGHMRMLLDGRLDDGEPLPGVIAKKEKWQDADAEAKYAPHLLHFMHGTTFGGDDLARLRKLAHVCRGGFARHRATGVWVEHDGSAVATDGYRMAWTELEFAPPVPLWIPASLIKSARKSIIVEWTPGSAWAHGVTDGFLEYLWEDPTYKDGYVDWRRPIPERPDLRPLAFDFKALKAVGKDETGRRRTEFRPDGLFPDGVACKMDAEYLESVPRVLGRKGLKAYAVRGSCIRYDGAEYSMSPVWFRGGGIDMLIMPMRPD